MKSLEKSQARIQGDTVVQVLSSINLSGLHVHALHLFIRGRVEVSELAIANMK